MCAGRARIILVLLSCPVHPRSRGQTSRGLSANSASMHEVSRFGQDDGKNSCVCYLEILIIHHPDIHSAVRSSTQQAIPPDPCVDARFRESIHCSLDRSIHASSHLVQSRSKSSNQPKSRYKRNGNTTLNDTEERNAMSAARSKFIGSQEEKGVTQAEKRDRRSRGVRIVGEQKLMTTEEKKPSHHSSRIRQPSTKRKDQSM
ncbi:hypothetical protein IWZ00DRAFT_242508 [Phyllosticta capitalensis]|uniref:uncharacterized protein n=1 Tax=Phyllosticta capitalensis TaxID=121624 RepID=UPI003130B64B